MSNSNGNSGTVTLQTGTASTIGGRGSITINMYEDFKTQYRWEEKFAYLPTFVEKKLIWRKYYYIKLEGFEEMWDAGAGQVGRDILWRPIKVTLSPTEYILFGEKNEKKI